MPSNLAPYQWRPGQSGNVHGIGVNKLQLAIQIRKISKNGRELIDFLFSVLRGEAVPCRAKTAGISPGSRRARAWSGANHDPPLRLADRSEEP
jgi:hypothetical protein